MNASDHSRRLAKEYRSLSDKTTTSKSGFEVDLVDESLAHWNVKLKNFEGSLANELKMIGRTDHILLEVKFDSDYPAKPPFVRVVTPKFKFHTGHVTIGGSICTELLTNSSSSGGWKSTITMESVILTVRQLLVDGKAKIESKGTYTEAAAREAFERVARQHGWIDQRARYLLVVLIVCGAISAVAAAVHIFLF